MVSVFKRMEGSIRGCQRISSLIPEKLVFLVLLLGSSLAVATDVNQWQTVALKVDDGLPDSTVYSMAQDQTGFMWFGTTSGLARYDGYSFKVFRHDGADQNSLSNNNSGNIYLDSKNRLWIGTFGGGANVMNLDDQTIKRFPYSNNNISDMISENVQTFFEDSYENIWVGTGTGLYKITGDELKFYGQNSIDNTTSGQSRVWDIEEDSSGKIWLGTSEGLIQLDPETGIFSQFKLPDELAINISSNQFRTLEVVDGILWIGSSTGLFSFDTDSKTFNYHAANEQLLKINDIHSEGDKLLIASMSGLHEFHALKKEFKRHINGELWHVYPHLDVRQILRGRSGLLWLATRDSGVVKVDETGGLFQLHTDYMSELKNNEKSKQVWTINTELPNNLLLGTSDTLFKLNSTGESERIKFNNMNDTPGIIRTIKARSHGGYWVGGSKGLFTLSLDGDIRVMNEPFELVGIEPTDVFSVTETLEGDVWLALYNLGVLHWDPKQNVAKLMQSVDGHSLMDMNIGVIYSDNHKHIWIGSNLAGVFRYDPEQKSIDFFKHEYGNPNSISSNRIKDIFQDSAGRMWVGTARGLNQFDPQSHEFRQITQTDGLLSDSIRSIHEDSKQNLWISSTFGVSRYNPEKNEINNYVLNEAISNDGFITRSSAIDENDVIYFGSGSGYYSFDPKFLKKNTPYRPPLKLTRVWLNNQVMSFSQWATKQLHFDLYHGDRTIGFEFAALDFKSPEQIKYRYRVVGVYEDWLNISSNRLIELSNLNPGSYQVEIKAMNNDGRWSEQSMLINLNVHPVWWNRGWVRGLVVILIIMLAFGFHQFRTLKIRKQNLLLENEVKNRTSELHDLNQQLKTVAHSDFLTHLPNRLSFIKTFEEKQYESSDNPGCLVMADIDHFKQINDQFGHAAGDLILVKVSELMRKMIRQEDLIARWGGEEFVFYFEGKSAQEILPLIERIRTSIENSEFCYADKIIPVTVTFGISQSKPGMSLNDNMNKADEAMYEGKTQGRNAVKIA